MVKKIMHKTRLEEFRSYISYWVSNMQSIYNGENGKDLSALLMNKIVERLLKEGCDYTNNEFITAQNKLFEDVKSYKTVKEFADGTTKMGRQAIDLFMIYSDT